MKHLMSLCFAAVMLIAPVSAFAQNAQDVMAKFSHEPTVEATMEAAIDYAGLSADRMESMYRRAGAANVLPRQVYYEFTGKYQDTDRPQKVFKFEDGVVEKKDADNKVVDAWTSYQKTDYHQDQDFTQHKARAQWDFSRLIYNSEQKNVVSLMNSVATTRDKLLKELTKVYFDRRKLQINMTVNPPSDVAARLEAELKLQELTATLDAMTGGWFSEQLRNNRN